jgi:hypothetical protein
MDRNLGAITKTPNLVTTQGMLYQWGRKDPFPGSRSTSAVAEPTLYTESGNTQVIALTIGTGNPIYGNLDVAVANPLGFCVSPLPDGRDWYSANLSITPGNANLWSTSKTVYDPCPPGWRVADASIFDGVVYTEFLWDSDQRGCVAPDYGGFYPATTDRHGNGGALEGGNINNVFLWYATAHTADGHSLSIRVIPSIPDYRLMTYHQRGHGFPVRCVQDQP